MSSSVHYGRRSDEVRSVSHALDMLELLAEHPEGLLIKAISLKLHYNLSTCYHLLNTLLAAEYVERDPDTGLIRIGPKVALLSNTVTSRLSDAETWKPIRPLLYRLTESTQAASYLAAWQHDQIVVQAIVEGPNAEKIPGIYVGYRDAADTHALGRVLLSFGAPDAVGRYLSGRAAEAPGLSDDTYIDRMQRIFAEVRRSGYGLDLEELVPGTCCVSAPIILPGRRGSPHAVASLAVSLPAPHYLHHREWIVRQVLKISAEASNVFAARPAALDVEWHELRGDQVAGPHANVDRLVGRPAGSTRRSISVPS